MVAFPFTGFARVEVTLFSVSHGSGDDTVNKVVSGLAGFFEVLVEI